MSALNLIRATDAAFLITDGGAFDSQNILVGICSKQIVLPNIPAVLAIRGDLRVLHLFAQLTMFCGAQSFDDFKNYADGRMHAEFKQASQGLLSDEQISSFELGVAGWSDSKPDSFVLTGSRAHGLPTWTVLDLGEKVILPSCGVSDGFIEPHQFETDPAGAARQLLALQRDRRHLAPHSKTLGFCIGGFAQLSIVTATGIGTQVIERWPDQIGQPITP